MNTPPFTYPHKDLVNTRASLLDEAKSIVSKDRNTTYGEPEDSFGKIAKVWSALTGLEITPEQVTIMMQGLKLCRAWENPGHRDNWVDSIGYGACGGELALRRARQEKVLNEGINMGQKAPLAFAAEEAR